MSQLYDDPIFGDFFKTLKRYQVHLSALVISALLIVLGYSYSLDSTKQYNAMAMDYYIQYLDAVESSDRLTAENTLHILKSRYTTHLYSSIAALSHSAQQISAQNFEQAKIELSWVFHHSHVPFFSDLAHYKFAEIAKHEGNKDLLKHHIALIQNPEVQTLGNHVLASSLAEEGLFDEAREKYLSLMAECQDSTYQALLTNEYHIINLLIS